jgi:hypothetical protein
LTRGRPNRSRPPPAMSCERPSHKTNMVHEDGGSRIPNFVALRGRNAAGGRADRAAPHIPRGETQRRAGTRCSRPLLRGCRRTQRRRCISRRVRRGVGANLTESAPASPATRRGSRARRSRGGSPASRGSGWRRFRARSPAGGSSRPTSSRRRRRPAAAAELAAGRDPRRSVAPGAAAPGGRQGQRRDGRAHPSCCQPSAPTTQSKRPPRTSVWRPRSDRSRAVTARAKIKASSRPIRCLRPAASDPDPINPRRPDTVIVLWDVRGTPMTSALREQPTRGS